MVAHACNPQKAEARGLLQIWGHPGQKSLKKHTNKTKTEKEKSSAQNYNNKMQVSKWLSQGHTVK